MYILDDGLIREDCEEKRVFGQKRDERIGRKTAPYALYVGTQHHRFVLLESQGRIH
jgi:hypothetical protein